MPGTISAGGNVLYSWLIMVNLTPVSVLANTTSEQSFTIQGLQLGDFIDVYFFGATLAGSTQLAGVGIVNNRVSSANTLQIGFINSTVGALTPNAGFYYISVNRPEVQLNQLPAFAG